jgi:hypothetical protein
MNKFIKLKGNVASIAEFRELVKKPLKNAITQRQASIYPLI